MSLSIASNLASYLQSVFLAQQLGHSSLPIVPMPNPLQIWRRQRANCSNRTRNSVNWNGGNTAGMCPIFTERCSISRPVIHGSVRNSSKPSEHKSKKAFSENGVVYIYFDLYNNRKRDSYYPELKWKKWEADCALPSVYLPSSADPPPVIFAVPNRSFSLWPFKVFIRAAVFWLQYIHI